MLHVLRRDGQPFPDPVLRSMFAARKAVFVDLLRWEVPVLDGRFEIDEFDDAHAQYIVLADAEGSHLGSARLLPTMRPHILDSLYPQLCALDPPRADDVLEVTRFCLDRGLAARERRAVRDTLVAALAEHALDNGVASYTAVAEMGWYQQIFTFGWQCRPLGPPVKIAGRMLGALRIDIDGDTSRRLAAAGILPLPDRLDSAARAAA